MFCHVKVSLSKIVIINDMEYAPIVVFAFNRLEALKACIYSLLCNSEASESDLIVFVDGSREGKDGEKKKVEDVRAFVKNITGFKSLAYQFSDINKGLATSIIDGVSQVIKLYGRAIVMEDDLICSSNFLAYMNRGLEHYLNLKDVFSICGYSNKVKVPNGYKYDSYFCPRSSSWGWATWRDRWDSCDWELNNWNEVVKHAKVFNRWGGSDCFSMLKGWKEGRNNSWAIRFCYNQFVQNKLSLFPIVSYVKNNGFDGEGTNCPQWSRFKSDFDESDSKSFIFPNEVLVERKIVKSAMVYNSIKMRLYSKFRNLVG